MELHSPYSQERYFVFRFPLTSNATKSRGLLSAVREQAWAEEALTIVEQVVQRVKNECDFIEGTYYSSSELCVAVSANRVIEELKDYNSAEPIIKKENVMKHEILRSIVEFIDHYKDKKTQVTN